MTKPPPLRQRKPPRESIDLPWAVEHPRCRPQDAYDEQFGFGYSDNGSIGLYSSRLFSAAYAIFLLMGLVCLGFPPTAATTVSGLEIPSNARCLRAARHADYISLEINIGSPSRRIRALLRLDRVVNDTQDALRVFESKVLESRSANCNGLNSTCSDVVLLTTPSENGFERVVTSFSYTSEAIETSLAKSYLGLEAELSLVAGFQYWITSSHLCFSASAAPGEASSPAVLPGGSSTNLLRGSVTSEGTMVVAASDLAKASILRHSFARQVTVDFLCTFETKVQFLPALSTQDSLYLSIVDYAYYSSEPAAIHARRNLVEVGTACAERLPKANYGNDYELYLLDCRLAGSCASGPSIPYRRISTMGMHIDVIDASSFIAQFENDPTLSTLPGLSDTEGAITLAVAKLVLVVIAASMVWVRADRSTSKPYWQFKHCLHSVQCGPPMKSSNMPYGANTGRGGGPDVPLVEDAVMGLLCIGIRFSIAFWRYETLGADSQGRACTLEIIGSALSLIHFLLRYFVIAPSFFDMLSGEEDANGPLTRLGGATAILDVTGSVLLAFSEPPTLVSTLTRFEPTARILISMLTSMVALPKALFSIACCALLYEAGSSGRTDSNSTYQYLLLGSIFSWILQLIVLSTTLCDLIVTPFAISLTRSTLGGTFWVRVALFLGCLNVGIPRLVGSVVKLKGL